MSRVENLEARVRGEQWVALPKSEYDALIAIEKHLRVVFTGWQGKSRTLLERLEEARKNPT